MWQAQLHPFLDVPVAHHAQQRFVSRQELIEAEEASASDDEDGAGERPYEEDSDDVGYDQAYDDQYMDDENMDYDYAEAYNSVVAADEIDYYEVEDDVDAKGEDGDYVGDEDGEFEDVADDAYGEDGGGA